MYVLRFFSMSSMTRTQLGYRV